MATIVQRGPASFLVRIRQKGLPVMAKTFDTKHEAETWVKRQELKLEDGTVQDLTEARETTLGQALERYRDTVTVKKKSHKSEFYRVGRILRHQIALRPLSSLRADDVEALLHDLAKPHESQRYNKPRTATTPPVSKIVLRPASPVTQRRYAALLSHVFTIASKRWRIEGLRNPVKEMEMPAAGRSRKRRFEDGEEERLLRELAACRKPQIKPFVQLAVETAMRSGELLKLQWENVDLAGQTAEIHDTKNGEDRVVPLSSRALAIFKALQTDGGATRIKGPVFSISTHSLRSGWEAACKRAGIVNLRIHDLRHEGTTRLFELGLDRIEAAAVTGHKTLQMLKDYTHLKARSIAQKLG